jgi:hypothetical protein
MRLDTQIAVREDYRTKLIVAISWIEKLIRDTMRGDEISIHGIQAKEFIDNIKSEEYT